MTKQLTPGHVQAGLPSPNPSKSYWLQDPSEILLRHRSTEALPEEADVVVVGSGITGAFAAHFLKNGLEGRKGLKGGLEVGVGCDLDGKGEGVGENDGDGGGEDRGEGEGEGEGTGERVVMLEAREACFGATGRNGGHCQPSVYGNSPAVAAFELANYHFLRELVAREGIKCDWVDVSGVHAYLTPALFAAAAAAAASRKTSHPDIAEGLEIVPVTDSARLAALRVPSVAGAIVQQRAASLWPYKLVAYILEGLISRFLPSEFNLQTNTAVTSIAPVLSGGDSKWKWEVTTARGRILTRQLLLATNGYTSHLLPQMSDLVVPVRGQISALLPPETETAPLNLKLNHSYVFASQKGPTTPWREDYMVQRPTAPNTNKGELIFGGGRGLAHNKGINSSHDDVVEPAVAAFLSSHLSPPLDLSLDKTIITPNNDSTTAPDDNSTRNNNITPDDNSTPNPNAPNCTQHDLLPTSSWTGIMAYSRDHCPWVGPVPSTLIPSLPSPNPKTGLFVCAGYTGHGMPNAALSAHAVVGMMRTRSDPQTDIGTGAETVVGDRDRYVLPEEYVISEERVTRVRGGMDTVEEAQGKDVWLEAFPGLRSTEGEREVIG